MELSIESDPLVPEFVASDPTRLRQILLNIVGNAIKFTRHGHVRVLVKHKVRYSKPSQIEFWVSDTGCGIVEADQGRLFHPFSQANATMTRTFGGTGLGLALSRRLARCLGGDVELAESTPGSGSTFLICVDTGEDEMAGLAEAEPSIEETLPDITAPDQRLAGIRILLVDDSLDNRNLVKRFLTKSLAKVECATDGAQAIAMALDSDFDMVLMDIQMPEVDGYEATKSLRVQGYRGPIIA